MAIDEATLPAWQQALYQLHDEGCASAHRILPDTVACLAGRERRWQELITQNREQAAELERLRQWKRETNIELQDLARHCDRYDTQLAACRAALGDCVAVITELHRLETMMAGPTSSCCPMCGHFDEHHVSCELGAALFHAAALLAPDEKTK